MASIARRILVSGRVQGVAFRYCTQREARGLGLTGWVRNLSDGRVEAQLQGEVGLVQTMQAWLEHGPPAAHVLDCLAREAEWEEAADFELRPSVHAPSPSGRSPS